MTPIDTITTDHRAASPVIAAVRQAARNSGIDFNYLFDVARVESGFDTSARARTSSAAGLFQFTDQTWLATLDRHGRDHGLAWAADAIGRGGGGQYRVTDPGLRQRILGLRDDPAAAASMAAMLTLDNRAALSAHTGREPEAVDLYLAHFLGSAGAVQFLEGWRADPAQAGAALFPAAAAANRPVFYTGDGQPRSLDEIRELFRTKLDAGQGAGMTDAATQRVTLTRSRQVTAAPYAGDHRRLQLLGFMPMPRKLSVAFAADAYQRLGLEPGRAA